jgi:cell division septation protein DedD
VKTVTIRPDMTIVADVAAPRPVAAPASNAGAPANTGAVAAAQHAPAGPSRHVTSPLSLNPSGGVPAARAPSPAASTRGVEVASTSPATPSEAAAPTAGGYGVQVSSQRSEADAKASFKSLQAKYPNVLSGRPSYIRRADLGSKGVYYRTLIGPFATAEQAAAFCTSLKAAGGQCLIHRN